MSNIIKALKKAETQRHYGENIYTMDPAPVKSLTGYLPMIGMGLALILSLAALLRLEFSKNAVLDLSGTIEAQQRKIDRLSILLENNKKSSESQVKNLNDKLAELTKDYKIKVYSINTKNNYRYQELQEEISAHKRQMDILGSNLQGLNKKVDDVSDSLKVVKTL